MLCIAGTSVIPDHALYYKSERFAVPVSAGEIECVVPSFDESCGQRAVVHGHIAVLFFDFDCRRRRHGEKRQ